ncbi:hypothetical protein AA0116_g12242 [Alternaria tenuissima]|nr:hypothetical protein AA0116_g12242 [Alternaria tenuissima]
MGSSQDNGSQRRWIRNNTFPGDPPTAGDPPTVGTLMDHLRQIALFPSLQLPGVQRVQANSVSQNSRGRAGGAYVAPASRPATGAADRRQWHLPAPQLTITKYTISYDNLSEPPSPSGYDPEHLGLALQPAPSAGDTTPTAQSPQTPTLESPQLPARRPDTESDMIVEEEPQERDDITPCTPTSSICDVRAWHFECM